MIGDDIPTQDKGLQSWSPRQPARKLIHTVISDIIAAKIQQVQRTVVLCIRHHNLDVVATKVIFLQM